MRYFLYCRIQPENFEDHYIDFQIIEVGKTLTTRPDDTEFQQLGGSDTIDDLLVFIMSFNMLHRFTWKLLSAPGLLYYAITFEELKAMFESRLSNTEMRTFKKGQF